MTWYCSGVSRHRHSSSLWVTSNFFSCIAHVSLFREMWCLPPIRSSHHAIEKLNGNSLGRAQERDAHSRTHRGWLFGELDALCFKFGHDRVYAAHTQPEMVE